MCFTEALFVTQMFLHHSVSSIQTILKWGNGVITNTHMHKNKVSISDHTYLCKNTYKKYISCSFGQHIHTVHVPLIAHFHALKTSATCRNSIQCMLLKTNIKVSCKSFNTGFVSQKQFYVRAKPYLGGVFSAHKP